MKWVLHNFITQLAIIAISMICLNCQETMITKDFISDLDLILAIENAKNKVIISKNSLPEKTRISISFNYSGNYVSKSELAPKLGYQVDLRKHKGRQVADKTVAYFDIDGKLLQANEDYKFKGEERPRGGKKGNRKKKDLADCFDFIYPFTFTMPDASKIEISDAKGWDFVKAWYEANPEEQDRPTFIFPLNVLVENTEMKINNENEFESVAKECKDIKNNGEEKEDCFELLYPFTLRMPDSTLITVETIDSTAVVNAWHDSHPEVKEKGVFVFPIGILFRENEMKINDQDELKSIFDECKNGKRRDRKKEYCFEVVYPYTLLMPDGTLITLQSKDDRKAVKAWHENHPEVKEKGIFIFPIVLEYPKGDKVEINSKEDFEDIKKDC